MYSDLIIGYDGSPAAQDALAFARRLAVATGGRLRVVCVRTRRAVEPTLDEARELVADVPGATFEAVTGASPARGLCAAAAGAEAALIVVGSTHRSGLGRVVAGSTAEAVVHAAPCAVAIVPAGYAETARRRPFGLVAAAVDGSDETDRVARIASRVARGAGADLRLLCVVARPYGDGPVYAAGVSYATVENSRRSAAVTALERAAAAAAGAGVDTEPRLCEGPLEAEVALESEACDLLVIGSRGLGPLGRVLLGAATGRILDAAACPVLVVSRRAAEWLDDALVPLAGAGVR